MLSANHGQASLQSMQIVTYVVLLGKLMFLFVNQSYLVKGAKLRLFMYAALFFILYLNMASASVVNFCVSQKEMLEIGGGGAPLVLLHPFPSPSQKRLP